MQQPNILFITVDDMNYDSIGKYQSSSFTPNIDQLASSGVHIENAHVTVAVCQPSRQCIMTGKYPHNNGSHGFSPISHNVTTLQEILSDKGYFNGIISKVGHLAPIHKYAWDYIKEFNSKRYMWGRKPELYYEKMKDFIGETKKENKPFFLMVNCNDPHRPFAGSQQEFDKYGENMPVRKQFKPEEVTIPGFLPDIPEVRLEVSEYVSSAHRADASVGMMLKAIDEAGLRENTIVVFLSDNGMAFPYAKTNCYLNSTKTPLIVSWPKNIKTGHDKDTFVSGIDLMPTLLELINIKCPVNIDGKSFANNLIRNNTDHNFDQNLAENREYVFTLFNANYKKMNYEMRCVQSKNYGFIFNAWSDGKYAFMNESMTGRTFNAMKKAALDRPDIGERVKFYLHRVPEEFYDFKNDPDGLNNLIDDPQYSEMIDTHRLALIEEMRKSHDPILVDFIKYIEGSSN